MAHTTLESVHLDEIIKTAREMRGIDFVPLSVTKHQLGILIQTTNTQYWDLKRSGVGMGYSELLKNVCEARTFSDDREENWVLQYAYQIVGMMYFGRRKKDRAQSRREEEQEHADRFRDMDESFTALVAELNKRERQK